MGLIVRGREASTVFALLGTDENSATFALGWALERSPAFRNRFIEAVIGERLNLDHVAIHLQKHREQGGFTDIEMIAADRCHLIIEAKRGWDVPTVEQLERYAVRLPEASPAHRLVSISSADAAYASRHLPPMAGGAAVVHRSWTEVRRLADAARTDASGYEEKLWLRQLVDHLEEYIAVNQTDSNRVYVVSLGSAPMVECATHTWIDVVEKDGCYFHPIGAGWPQQPPNYIAFRHDGQLQSVHHIDSFEVVRNLAEKNPLWLETDSDHFVYRLGPAMRPTREVRTGNLFRNGRVWCAIDTLLSGAYKTISKARDETDRRMKAVL